MPMPMRKAELERRGRTSRWVRIPTREQLIGAWRLVSIESATPGGAVVDPFFEKGSAGFIVYDASGWMSVQISGPHQDAAAPGAAAPGAAVQRVVENPGIALAGDARSESTIEGCGVRQLLRVLRYLGTMIRSLP